MYPGGSGSDDDFPLTGGEFMSRTHCGGIGVAITFARKYVAVECGTQYQQEFECSI